MDEQTFKHELARAKTFRDLGENSDYWNGYMRGLRRKFHGESFGTIEEHRKCLSLIDDSYRKEFGRGYCDGFGREDA